MDDILFITADSLRADHLSSYGYGRETTPNIDTLADSGHRFTNTFANACMTRASFPAIMTSTSPLAYGGYNDALSPERTVLAEPLSEAGYQTAGFHSNLFLSADYGYDRGFDTFYDSKPDPSRLDRLREFVKDRLDSDGLVYNLLARGVDRAERNVGVNFGSRYTKAGAITDLAIEWLEETDSTRPTFLWVHYMDTHHPYVPPEEFQRPFREEPVSRRRALRLRRKMLEDPEELTEEEHRTLVDLYDAEIRYTDDQVGRLVETFREHRTEEPFTVFTADHGEAFGEHGQYSHHSTFYDEVIHVPLVMHDGDEDGPTVHDELVALLDVPATLVSRAVDATPETYRGSDLDAVMSGGEWDRTEVVSEFDAEGGEMEFSLRTAGWKFVQQSTDETLYDLSEDPDETTDVLDDYPERAEQFRRTLEAHADRIESTATETESVEVDESVRQRLRELGYHE